MKLSFYTVIIVFLLSSCVTTPRHFISAGFDTKEEAQKYIHNYLYYANKLTDKEWDDFYSRFPEYWKDIQDAKLFGSNLEYHPWYTAYSFKWNTDKRKLKWSKLDSTRLKKREILKGDNVFKVIYARGVPDRVIWNNDFEIFIFKSGDTLIFKNGAFNKESKCNRCYEEYFGEDEGMSEDDVLESLNLSRPKY